MKLLPTKTLLLLILLSCFLFSGVGGVGFKFHTNKKSGEKRLWLHVPGSEPNVLTDFEEKPYTGHKNLIDVNRPSDVRKKIQRPPSSYSSNPKDDVEELYIATPKPRRTSRRKLERFIASYPSEEDGYHYNPPQTPFQLPGQVGNYYPPDVPDEENYGIGLNSEENKDILAGRPDNDGAAEVFKPRPKPPSTPASPQYCPTPAEIAYGAARPPNCLPGPDDGAAEVFKPRPKTTTTPQPPPVYCPTEPAYGYAPRRPANCIPRPTPGPEDGAAEVFKPRPKPSTPASPQYCPSHAEIAYGRPRPANCIPRPTPKPDDGAAEVFKPRPKTTTTQPPPVYCPTEPAFGYAPRRPINCIPRPIITTPKPAGTTTPDDGAAEVFKPRPKTTPASPQYCPSEAEIAYGRPRPENCIPRPTTRPTIPPLCPEEGMDGFYRPRPHNCRPRPTLPPRPRSTTPDDGAAEVFKPRPKPTTPPTPEFCPSEAEIAYGKPRPANCIPRPTLPPKPPTTTPDDGAAEVFKPRPKPITTPPPQFCPSEAEIAYGRPRPANCIPRPTTRPTIPPLCPEEGMDGFYRPRPHNCRPRPTLPPKPQTTTPDDGAAEVFKPRPKPTTPPTPEFCPTEAEIAYGKPRPPHCIPRPTPTPKPVTTTPDDGAAEVFKPRPKPSTPASPQLCPTEAEIAAGKPRPANCIPRPTPTPTTPLPFCPGRKKPTAPMGRADLEFPLAPRAGPIAKQKCRPLPTTTTTTQRTTTPDDGAAEVFKPRPKPSTPASPQYCPTEAEIAGGRPRPLHCIPRPTTPPPRRYCPDEGGGDIFGFGRPGPRPPNCIPKYKPPTERPYLPPRPIPEYLPLPPTPCSGYGPCPGEENQGGYGPAIHHTETGGWGWSPSSDSASFSPRIQPTSPYTDQNYGGGGGERQILPNCGPGTPFSCEYRSPRVRPRFGGAGQGSSNHFRPFGGSQPVRFSSSEVQQRYGPNNAGNNNGGGGSYRTIPSQQGGRNGGRFTQGQGRNRASGQSGRRRNRNFPSTVTSVHKIKGGTLTFVQSESRFDRDKGPRTGTELTDRSDSLRSFGNYGINNKNAAECGRGQRDEYFNHRIGKCVDRRASRIRY